MHKTDQEMRYLLEDITVLLMTRLQYKIFSVIRNNPIPPDISGFLQDIKKTIIDNVDSVPEAYKEELADLRRVLEEKEDGKSWQSPSGNNR